jgi:hypothetical protein
MATGQPARPAALACYRPPDLAPGSRGPVGLTGSFRAPDEPGPSPTDRSPPTPTAATGRRPPPADRRQVATLRPRPNPTETATSRPQRRTAPGRPAPNQETGLHRHQPLTRHPPVSPATPTRTQRAGDQTLAHQPLPNLETATAARPTPLDARLALLRRTPNPAGLRYRPLCQVWHHVAAWHVKPCPTHPEPRPDPAPTRQAGPTLAEMTGTRPHGRQASPHRPVPNSRTKRRAHPSSVPTRRAAARPVPAFATGRRDRLPAHLQPSDPAWHVKPCPTHPEPRPDPGPLLSRRALLC